MTPHDLDIMWRTVYGESRSEGQFGKRAVAHVIRNRVADPRWPDTIAEVCQQPRQFSCWNEGDPNLPKLKAANPDIMCLDAIVDSALNSDPTNGANHYLTRALYDSDDRPGWADDMQVTASIGGHVFLRGEL